MALSQNSFYAELEHKKGEITAEERLQKVILQRKTYKPICLQENNLNHMKSCLQRRLL